MAGTFADQAHSVDASAPTELTPTEMGDASTAQIEMPSAAKPSDTIAAGRVLADKFKLVRLIGKGGMGSVWAAEHLGLRSEVAVKVINPHIARSEQALGRFVREAQAAASLRSPNVVQIFDYGVDDGTPYIVMELLVGEPLSQRIKRTGPLGVATTLAILKDMCRAIARAHEAGIVHRDLKPDNVFLVKDADREVAKILDFGIAKAQLEPGITGDGESTSTGALLGTPYYVSPEQAMNAKDVDHRTDLWALGVIAYECLVGQRPFVADQITALVLQICTEPLPVPSKVGNVPRGFDRWFQRALQREPDKRFQGASELYASLEDALGHRLSSSAMVPISLPRSGGRTRLPLVAGALAVTTGLAALLWLGPWRELPTPPERDVEAEATPATKTVEPAVPPSIGVPEESRERSVEAAAPPEEVSIAFDGAPAGTTVLIDGEAVGTTDEPLLLPHDAQGAVNVRLEASGYEALNYVVTPDRDRSYEVELSKIEVQKKKRTSRRIEAAGTATKKKRRFGIE